MQPSPLDRTRAGACPRHRRTVWPALDGRCGPRVVGAATHRGCLAQRQGEDTWTPPLRIAAATGGLPHTAALAIDDTGARHVVWLTTGDKTVISHAAVP